MLVPLTKVSVEADVVVIAACMPTLQPLLELILRKLKLVSTGRGIYDDTSYQNRDYVNHSSSRAIVSSRKSTIPFSKIDSDEVVLNDQDNMQIRCTDEVQIEYEMQPQKPTQKRSFG
jgi:hypothetical protein